MSGTFGTNANPWQHRMRRADAENMIGIWPSQGLHRSLHDEQKQNEAFARTLPNANGALHFRVVLANFHINQSTIVKAKRDVDEMVR